MQSVCKLREARLHRVRTSAGGATASSPANRVRGCDRGGTRTSPLLRLRVCEQSAGEATASSPANRVRGCVRRGRGRPRSCAFVCASRAPEGRRPRRPQTGSAAAFVGDEDVPAPAPSCVRAERRRGDGLVARKQGPRLRSSGPRTSPLLRLRVCEQSAGGATASSPANRVRGCVRRGRGRPRSCAFVCASRAPEGRRPRRPQTGSAAAFVGDEDVPAPAPSCVRAERRRGDGLAARKPCLRRSARSIACRSRLKREG